MKSISVCVLGAAFVFAAGCASSPEPGAVAANANDPARIICRNEAKVGSRLPKKTCKSALEWDEIAAKNLEDRRNLGRSAIGPSEAGAAPGN